MDRDLRARLIQLAAFRLREVTPFAPGGRDPPTWDVKFVQGGPTPPKPFQSDKPVSWKQSGSEEAQAFAGTALFTLTFDAPAQSATHYSLDLGDVRQSARVKLNGKDLGTVFVKPFHASGWPVADQGLLGPVTLQPEKEFTAAP